MKTLLIPASALLVSSLCLAQPGAGGAGGAPGGRAGGAPGGGAAAGAGGGMPTNEVIMGRNDANKDGKITLAEAQAAQTQLGQMFATFDLDGNGEVVASELDTARAQFAGRGGGRGGAAPGGRAGGAAPGGRGGPRGGAGAASGGRGGAGGAAPGQAGGQPAGRAGGGAAAADDDEE